jgi:Na+/H+-dicarboxylate symporter
MNGTAIYLVICVMFIGFATGRNPNLNQQLTFMIAVT